MDTATGSINSQKQIELFLKLESIFTPHFRNQRDQTFDRLGDSSANKVSARFAHYTSADAALKIIKSKRLWMRNTTCMSDYREVQHGFEILRNFFSDKPKMDSFIAALDPCVPGAAKEGIDRFNQWWKDIQFNTYIGSISEHNNKEDLHGRLSMWRAFGGKTARVAIIFNVPWISEGARALELIFSPVAYLTEKEVHNQIYDVIKNIEANQAFLRSVPPQEIVGSIFSMLLVGVTCMKHEGFREEREWRAIYRPNFRPSKLVESSTEVVEGIPQIVYKLPLDSKKSPELNDLDLAKIFDRIIIGPSPYPLAISQAFVMALSEAGVADAHNKVVISGIPIRA